jgi:hypothetical protein
VSDEIGGWADDAAHHSPDAPDPAGLPFGDDWHGLSGGFDHGHPYDLGDPTDPGDPGADGAGHADGDPHAYAADPDGAHHGPATGDEADGTAHGLATGHADADAGGSETAAGADSGPDGPEHHGVTDGVDGVDGGGPWGLAQPVDAHDFPPHLDLDVVPADGLAWVDVDLLGDPTALPADPLVVPDSPQALLADLHAQDGADGAPSWAAVTGSDDPAGRALALFWQPR